MANEFGLKSLAMNVGQICKQTAVTVLATDELNTAAQLMRDQQVGFLVVVEPGPKPDSSRPIGVLTDRDIVVAVIARGVDPKTLRVEDVMVRDPIVALATEPLEVTLPKMRKSGVRRVPVIGYCGELFGVLSFEDLFDTIASELRNVAGAVRTEALIEATMEP